MMLPVHPVAAAFPDMPPDRFAALKDDIAKQGRVVVPVIVWRGQIIDGRHRARACEALAFGYPTQDEECDESELPALVWSLNGERRDLTPSQRAMIAAKLANLESGTNQYEKKVGSPMGEPTLKPIDRLEAAKLVGVGHSSVDRALTVIRSGDREIIDKVEQGEMSVRAAEAVVKEKRTSTPRPAPTRGRNDEKVIEVASAPMRRVFAKPANDVLDKAISLVGEMAHMIEAHAAGQNPDDDTRRLWQEILDEAIPTLRKFRKTLNEAPRTGEDKESDHDTLGSRSA